MPKLYSIIRAEAGSEKRYSSKLAKEIPEGESEGDKLLAKLEKHWTASNLLRHCKGENMTPAAARALAREGFHPERVTAAWLYYSENMKLECDYVDEDDMFEDVHTMLKHYGNALDEFVWSERPINARDVSKWLDDIAHDVMCTGEQ